MPGKPKSRVNEAGNYTKPKMRKRLFQKIKAGGKGVSPDSGLQGRHKCWRVNMKPLAEDTWTDAKDGISKKS